MTMNSKDRSRSEIRADWCRQARNVVATENGLTNQESVTLNDAAEILKGRPDILSLWIAAATEPGAILGLSFKGVTSDGL